MEAGSWDGRRGLGRRGWDRWMRAAAAAAAARRFQLGWEVTQLPPEVSALARRHLGSLITDLIWML
jgi:hypothetical protein